MAVFRGARARIKKQYRDSVCCIAMKCQIMQRRVTVLVGHSRVSTRLKKSLDNTDIVFSAGVPTHESGRVEKQRHATLIWALGVGARGQHLANNIGPPLEARPLERRKLWSVLLRETRPGVRLVTV